MRTPLQEPDPSPSASSSDERVRPCHGCGQEVSVSQLSYGEDGGQVCLACVASAQVAASFRRSYKNMALAALGAALFLPTLSLFVGNPFSLIIVFVMISGIVVAYRALSYKSELDAEDRRQLEGLRWPSAVALASLLVLIPGLLVSLASVAIFVGGLFGFLSPELARSLELF